MKMKSAASAFAQPHSDTDDDEDDEEGKKKDARSKVNKDVIKARVAMTNNAKIEAMHKKAMEEDPNVFDYDGVYDAMKEAQDAIKKEKDLGEGGDSVLKKPKYVEKIFAASVARKIALEQAEDRKVQKERELEGELFADKDAFVTEAYKQRQLELKKLEEEERLREERESKGDMATFYRTLLNSHDRLSKPGRNLTPEEITRLTQTRDQRAREESEEHQLKLQQALETGELRLNDNDEIVDKRALLLRGLNVSRSKARMIQAEKEEFERARLEAERRERERREEEARRRREEAARRKAKEELALRMQEEAERQEEEEREKRRRERERDVEVLAKKMAKRTTEETVSEARARYLARKAAASGGKKKGDDDSDSD
ncbi:hypothetical protein HDU67_000546 [Dinochytrium kinnereticum]|nr:hypothetical protein HDU67_000546 [Dinochytrium kinnereticum]